MTNAETPSQTDSIAQTRWSGLRLGLDVGGTNLRLGVFEGLTLIEEVRFQADYRQICADSPPAEAWRTIINVTASAIANLLTKYPALLSIGIGFPGFINPQTGLLAQSPNLPGLKNVNLGADLSAKLARKVSVFNDANAAAFGEYARLGQPSTGLLYLGLGTGVGGGLVINGELLQGVHGYALEVGHINVVTDGLLCGCGNRGCLEQYASATAIHLGYLARTQQALSAQQVADHALHGDVAAIAVYQTVGEKLGQAIAMVLNVVDVSQVVIGGGVAAAWPLFAPHLMTRLNQDLIPVLKQQIHCQASAAGDVAGMLGAALLA